MTDLQKLEKYVQRMADDAENENYHSMVGTYERISNTLLKWVSPPVALEIMRDIGSLI